MYIYGIEFYHGFFDKRKIISYMHIYEMDIRLNKNYTLLKYKNNIFNFGLCTKKGCGVSGGCIHLYMCIYVLAN